MAIKFRIDLYLHVDQSPDSGLLQEIVAATQQLRARNDQLAEAVARLGGQHGSASALRTSFTGDFNVSTGNASQAIENLRVEVERNASVDGSAITLLTTLAARLEEAKNDPAAIQGLVDELRGSSDSLAAAVVANTPAEEGSGGG